MKETRKMETEELETRLRRLLHQRAARITETDLTRGGEAGEAVAPLTVRPNGSRWQGLIAVAAVLLVIALAAAGLAARRPASDMEQLQQPAPESGGGPASSPESPARAWPLTNDEPLRAENNEEQLRTPEAAARAYLSQVVGLPAEWPIDEIETEGDRAVARYVLQDVEAQIDLGRDANGPWYVLSGETELIRPALPTSILSPTDVSIAAGPRMYDAGADVRVTVLATDGRVLASATTRVEPTGEHRDAGQAGAAPVVTLSWDNREVVAAVRADVVDDHDGDPATPAATIGHWTTALPGPGIGGLPTTVDVATSAPLFSAPGSADEVAEAYMRTRLPDYPAPDVELDPAFYRGRRAYVSWSTGQQGEPIAAGIIGLRVSGQDWSVIAVNTHDVDVSDLRSADGKVSGTITTTNINSLYADVFQPDDTPAPGSPRPEGQPGAAYRFGTAGGPGDKSLDIAVPVQPGSAVVRVNLVGGTLLSLTEFRIPVPER
ncbi:MAG TPA: hypothetical protein VMY88_08090 [Acidimicrobiales bacterium]|nr:hypothetical protein [Acidimicrobiales bacterium]